MVSRPPIFSLPLRSQRQSPCSTIPASFAIACHCRHGFAGSTGTNNRVSWLDRRVSMNIRAEQGDIFAQAMLGLVYDKGHGVPQDFVLAYKWLNLATAHARGRQRDVFQRLRDAVASKMSPNEIAAGQRLALYWTPAGFR